MIVLQPVSNTPITYETKDKNSKAVNSNIDHCIMSPALNDLVSVYNTEFLLGNFSDHKPLMLNSNIDILHLNTYISKFNPNIAWHKCNVTPTDVYKRELDWLLLTIDPNNEALSCRKYNCSSDMREIQELHY